MGLRMVYQNEEKWRATDFMWHIGKVVLEAVFLERDARVATAEYGQVRPHSSHSPPLYVGLTKAANRRTYS